MPIPADTGHLRPSVCSNSRCAFVSGFRPMRGRNGHDPVCKLDAGIYPVSETISLGRSNVTIEGTVLGSLLETTLQRAPGFDGALISDVNAIGTTSEVHHNPRPDLRRESSRRT